MHSQTPLTLTFMMRSNCSSSPRPAAGFFLDAGAVDGAVDAAVVETALSTSASTSRRDRYIGFNEQRLAARFDDQGRRHVAAVDRRVGDDDAGARAPECQRHRAADAAGATRYQHNLAGIGDAARRCLVMPFIMLPLQYLRNVCCLQAILPKGNIIAPVSDIDQVSQPFSASYERLSVAFRVQISLLPGRPAITTDSLAGSMPCGRPRSAAAA
jgi:hypothetical protein